MSIHKQHMSIVKHLEATPTKKQIVAACEQARVCLSKSTISLGVCKPGEHDLDSLNNEMIPKIFRQVIYPNWIYNLIGGHTAYGGNHDAYFSEFEQKGRQITDTMWLLDDGIELENDIDYGSVLVTPDFGRISIQSFPNISKDDQELYKLHFHGQIECLPQSVDIRKLKSMPAYKYIKDASGSLMEDYAKMTFPIYASLIEQKDSMSVNRWDDFKFCGELVFFQVLAGWLYCYREELEKADKYYRNGSNATKKKKHYAIYCKESLIDDKGGLLEVQRRLLLIARRHGLTNGDLATTLEKIDSINHDINRSLEWYKLFVRVKDIYFETRAVYIMIYNLLEHECPESDVLKIIERLTVFLRGKPSYDKQLTGKIQDMIIWKKELESKFGMDAYQIMREDFNKERLGESGKKIFMAMDSLFSPPDEIIYPALGDDEDNTK